MNNKSANSVINRIQNAMHFNSDSEMCVKLEINRATLGNWRLRDSVPYSLCVIISESEGVSLDWLLTGEGQILKNDATKTHTKTELEISDLTSLFNEQEQQEILVALKEKREISLLKATVKKLQVLLPS
jgi:phage repressor protein C with HTH and peptisase S24 domain